MSKNNAIDNSLEILKTFSQKDPSYHQPILVKKKSFRGRSGRPKRYSEEEIFLYKLKKLATIGIDI